jgi:asparagine synthase (glutamine-hydrolysing)
MQPDPPRKSGIYALLRTDGGPLAAADLTALGFGVQVDVKGWLAQGHDSQSAAAVSDWAARGCQTIIVGEVEERAERARELALDPAASAGEIAAAALARFGSDTPQHLIGEWSLLQRGADGTVTAMISAARRDPVLYAAAGARIALAPDLFRLARIDWIDTTIDESGLLGRIGRDFVREQRGARTMLRGVSELHPGESLTIDSAGRISHAACTVFTAQPRFTGSFADMVAATDALLATIMAERLGRASRSAMLLSGGLDSSLLSAFAAETGADLLAITSVAPQGSGLPDEIRFAELVARHLGLPLYPVAPPEALDTFRPQDHILAGANGPSLPTRHCLTESFQLTARAEGARLLVNGCYGEMTATSRLPVQGLRLRLRAHAAHAWHALRGTGENAILADPFHIRIAPQRLANLPAPIREILAEPLPRPIPLPRSGPLGYIPGVEKALRMGNEFYPGALRMDFPFRDLRLLRLFAGFPVETLVSESHDRPVVRHLLDGRLPDAIRLRTRGMPASPDHLPRIRRQAAAARPRIAAFRQAELGEWVDLDWLDGALGRVAAHGPAGVADANAVQLTAIFAEFLLWWRTRF